MDKEHSFEIDCYVEKNKSDIPGAEFFDLRDCKDEDIEKCAKEFFDRYNNEYLAQKEYRLYSNDKNIYIVVDSIEDYGNGEKGYGSLYNTVVDGTVYQFVILSLSGDELSEKIIQAMEEILDTVTYLQKNMFLYGFLKIIAGAALFSALSVIVIEGIRQKFSDKFPEIH